MLPAGVGGVYVFCAWPPSDSRYTLLDNPVTVLAITDRHTRRGGVVRDSVAVAPLSGHPARRSRRMAGLSSTADCLGSSSVRSRSSPCGCG